MQRITCVSAWRVEENGLRVRNGFASRSSSVSDAAVMLPTKCRRASVRRACAAWDLRARGSKERLSAQRSPAVLRSKSMICPDRSPPRRSRRSASFQLMPESRRRAILILCASGFKLILFIPFPYPERFPVADGVLFDRGRIQHQRQFLVHRRKRAIQRRRRQRSRRAALARFPRGLHLPVSRSVCPSRANGYARAVALRQVHVSMTVARRSPQRDAAPKAHVTTDSWVAANASLHAAIRVSLIPPCAARAAM